MASKDKVGSWLGKDGKPSKAKEAYDSDSEESDITEPDTSGSPAKAASSGSSSSSSSDSDSDSDSDSSDSDSDEADAKDGGRERNIDWEAVIPKLRPALLDRSSKRRNAFIARYLYVTDEGKSM